MRLSELTGKRVAVWGAGREGRAALAAIAARLPGQRPTLICSAAEAEELQSRTAPAAGFDCVTSVPDLDLLRRFDVIVKSPGISPYRSPLPEALAAGVRVTSGSALWFGENVETRVIAVTGTKGKSTTSALIAHLLRAAGRRVALAGNIGMPLLELLDVQPPAEFCVVELSSFQTRDLDAVPEVAVLLNLYPEHLDWHAGEANYYADKLRLFGSRGARPAVSILNAAGATGSNPLAASAFDSLRRELDAEGACIELFGAGRGFELIDERLYRNGQALFALDDWSIPGAHNGLNLCAACTAIEAVGVDVTAVLSSLRSFRALPHRLQPLGEIDGISYVNDSIATTPHATLAALQYYRGRAVTVLVGGHDRGLDWSVFRDAMLRHPANAVIAMGANGPRIDALLRDLPAAAPSRLLVDGLDEAMRAARRLTPPGGVILLSPGAPSFGQFRDYVERGRRFAVLAGFDPERIARIEGLGL